MKILYHHRIASKDGQYVHVEEMIKAFNKLGHEIVIVAPALTGQQEFGSDGGLVATLKRVMPGAIYELMEFSYSFVAYAKLAKAIRKHKPDVIYERYNLFLLAGIWAKKTFKLPMLLEVNAPLYEERSKYNGISLKTFAHWAEAYAWRNASGVLPVTQVLANKVIAENVLPEHITVVPNGIDLDKFGDVPDLEMAKQKLGFSDRLVLGFTGFVRDWHGLDKVVDIVAHTNDRKRQLLIVGDGPARASIEQRAKELGVEDQVTITGIVGRDKVAEYVSAFDVALQPDVVDYASPLKMFEYLALGRAIVAPDKANIREILVHEQNALLFDVSKPAAFFTELERLCNDGALRQKISDNAKLAIAQQALTWDHNAQKVSAKFRELLGNQ